MSGEEERLVDLKKFRSLGKMFSRDAQFPGEGFDVENPPCWNMIRILVVGAGGLGCEILHCLALSGFEDIHVIDMDTIDMTNLNRQFLFRQADVGKAKSEVAAEFINSRFKHVRVTGHFCAIQAKDDDFFKSFHIVILGLDSIVARRWINEKYAQLAQFKVVDDPDNVGRKKTEHVSSTPVIDGGTEGFRGSARHIEFSKSACIECSMYLYPPQEHVAICTLANTPRNPAHCVLWVKMATRNDEKSKSVCWAEEKPFDGEKIDGDNPEHIVWIMNQAIQRAADFNIEGKIDFQFTQGVVKNVVPAVGFTNAMIAAMCSNEALKIATGIGPKMNNYTFYDGSSNGVTSYVNCLEADPDCPVCQKRKVVVCKKSWTPRDLIDKGVCPVKPKIEVIEKRWNAALERDTDVEVIVEPIKEGHEFKLTAEVTFGEAEDEDTATDDMCTKRVTLMHVSAAQTSNPHFNAQFVNETYGSASVYETLKAESADGKDFTTAEMELSGGVLRNKVCLFLLHFQD